MSYFEKVANRFESTESSEPGMGDHLVLAMKAMGMDPDDAAAVESFVAMLRKTTVAQVKTAARKLTGTRAKNTAAATKAAAKTEARSKEEKYYYEHLKNLAGMIRWELKWAIPDGIGFSKKELAKLASAYKALPAAYDRKGVTLAEIENLETLRAAAVAAMTAYQDAANKLELVVTGKELKK